MAKSLKVPVRSRFVESPVGFARLLLFSFRSNLNILIGFPIITFAVSAYLYDFYRYISGGNSIDDYILFPPSFPFQLILIVLLYASIPAIALRSRSMKLGILGPQRRASTLLSNILTTITLTTIAAYLSAVATVLISYLFATTLLGISPESVPSVDAAISFSLRLHLAFLPAFVSIALISYVVLVWGSQFFNEVVNLLVAILFGFFPGFFVQFDILSRDPRPLYLPLYYMLGVGMLISGVNRMYLPVKEGSDLPGYLPLTIGGSILIFALLSLVALYGYRRLNLGTE